jgi:predicted phage gp36 major capsid-like protein
MAEDGRKVRVRLTQTGRGLLQENVARRERWLKEALEKSLTDEERALLFKAGELLDRLAAYSGSGSSQRERLRAPAHFMSLQSSGRTEANRRTGFKPRRLVSGHT